MIPPPLPKRRIEDITLGELKPVAKAAFKVWLKVYLWFLVLATVLGLALVIVIVRFAHGLK